MSGQIGRTGAINVSSSDFSLPDTGKSPTSFLVKNETDDPVEIDVIMAYDGRNGTPVSTLMYPGWNPELIIAVKQKNGVTGLKWGI